MRRYMIGVGVNVATVTSPREGTSQLGDVYLGAVLREAFGLMARRTPGEMLFQTPDHQPLFPVGTTGTFKMPEIKAASETFRCSAS